jgi:hypothetical protein
VRTYPEVPVELFAVTVPVRVMLFDIALLIVGDVKVLFVHVCVPVSVVTVESIAIVTAPDPL